GTIDTLVSRLLALEGDARDFRVVSDGDIRAYMSLGPSYTSQIPSHTSPASTAQKYLSLVNRRKLRPRRTPLKFKSPMIAYSRKFVHLTIPPPASTTTAPVTTMSVPMSTNEPSKDTIHTHLDALDAAQEIGYTEDDFVKVDYIDHGKLEGYWTLELSELVAFHIDSGELMSMVSVVDAFRATINGTNPLYPSWDKISQVVFAVFEHFQAVFRFSPINLDNKHWVAATIYDSLTILTKIFDDTPQKMSKYGTLDCDVMTCKFIEMLTERKTIDIEHFGDDVGLQCQEFRADMALLFYATRCKRRV
ncbi:hypothetical protein Tco_1269690, partial [Tanacetum coccineum]